VLDTNWPEIIEIIGERGLLQVHPAPGIGTPLVATAMGFANAMLAYYDDRAIFDRLLQIFSDHYLEVTKVMLEMGAPVVFSSWHDLGVSAGWSPKIWRDAFKPHIKAHIDLVHSYGALYNYFDNGPMMALLPDLAEIGVDIVSTLCPPKVGDVDIARAKQLWGDRLCLHGNVDAIWVIQRGTPEQVREAVRENIRIVAPGGGYILGNSDCFMPGTPPENIEAYFRAAREFGRYPINLS
jgi:uroporphyrinogen decarboxylase